MRERARERVLRGRRKERRRESERARASEEERTSEDLKRETDRENLFDVCTRDGMRKVGNSLEVYGREYMKVDYMVEEYVRKAHRYARKADHNTDESTKASCSD
eukprot:3481940-Pleurochrysis_carterae.AAC.4